ncbi:uncharacterized protein LOC133923186 [Phragmites australis]|uniref:uncharacterized protein LOC133923186 n=1 Tax=Phragmites australis TaxID=29695 RepID=UPI002D7674DA|nr:uncharacterized protein LOC133923186 [Phragmites australis]
MAKTSVEFCVISARGMGRRSSLLKPQWFCVAWVDPNSKYCTKVDASGNSDPSWRMKFSVSVDEHGLSSMQQMALTVEVYRREPIFLREHLQGAAVVQMKEYFDKFEHGEEQSGAMEETASFQLRRKKSDKAHGFVDIFIRICKQEDAHAQFSGSHDGSKHPNQVGITLAIEDGPIYNYPPQPSSHYRGHSQDDDHYSNAMPMTTITRPGPSPTGSNSNSYQPPMIPQTLPPPTANPSFFPPPYPARGQVPQSYINLPPRRFAGQNGAPNLGMGLGAGALTAGTLIFGENVLPGPSFGAGLDGARLSVSSDAPF